MGFLFFSCFVFTGNEPETRITQEYILTNLIKITFSYAMLLRFFFLSGTLRP